jgi:hypothetical protein
MASIEELQERINLIGIESLETIKEESRKIGICNNECECDWYEKSELKEDRHLYRAYCHGDYSQVKYCEWYQAATVNEINEYFMDRRIERIEHYLRIDAKLMKLRSED